MNFAFTVQWTVQRSGTLIPSIQVSLEVFAETLRPCCSLPTPLYVLFISLKLLSWDLFSDLVWLFCTLLNMIVITVFMRIWVRWVTADFCTFFPYLCQSKSSKLFFYFPITSYNGSSHCFLIMSFPSWSGCPEKLLALLASINTLPFLPLFLLVLWLHHFPIFLVLAELAPDAWKSHFFSVE